MKEDSISRWFLSPLGDARSHLDPVGMHSNRTKTERFRAAIIPLVEQHLSVSSLRVGGRQSDSLWIYSSWSKLDYMWSLCFSSWDSHSCCLCFQGIWLGGDGTFSRYSGWMCKRRCEVGAFLLWFRQRNSCHVNDQRLKTIIIVLMFGLGSVRWWMELRLLGKRWWRLRFWNWSQPLEWHNLWLVWIPDSVSFKHRSFFLFFRSFSSVKLAVAWFRWIALQQVCWFNWPGKWSRWWDRKSICFPSAF